ncbi:hypothetical protein QOT17_015949 [Balamuthia mandrillaris]
MILVLPALQQASDHYLCCRAYLLIASQLFCGEPPTNTAQLEKSIRMQQEYFQHIYGSNIKPKMHYLSHHPEDIKLWGSLWHLWCFPGE